MACSVERLPSPETHSEGYRLCPFEEDHAALVIQWCRGLEDLRWVAPCTPPPLTEGKVLDWHCPGVRPFILFDPANDPVGYGELVPSLIRPGEIWIAHLVIAPERRREGLGRRFIRLMLDKIFRDYDAENARLSVFEDNDVGRACYRRCGFRECGQRKLRPVWKSEEEPLVDMRVERFEWQAGHWMETLGALTAGTDWPRLYDEFRALRFEWEPPLRNRLDLIVSQIPFDSGAQFVAADFGAGPGILAEFIAERFPHAEVWAFDADPLQVLMGQSALREKFGQRIHFELTDLRASAWALGREGRFDFAASALALHWLNRDSLRRFYRTLALALKTDGVFVNADHIARDSVWNPSFGGRKWRDEATPRIPWDDYWRALKARLGVVYPCEQMAAELSVYEGIDSELTFRAHGQSLRNAGFSSVREIWRENGDAVLRAEK